MKRISLIFCLLVLSSLCFAQLKAPIQTDTLIVKSITYNYNEVARENWPFDVVYRTMTEFVFGDQHVYVESAEDYGYDYKYKTTEICYHTNNDELLKQYTKGSLVVIVFSGYELVCEKKDTYRIVDENLVKLVDEKPLFNGGSTEEFSKWVNQNLVYPKQSKKDGIQGRVTLQFTIETDGSVSNVSVLRGVAPELDAEAVRVVSSSPKWTPGKTEGQPVRVTYTFPVIFQLR